MCLCLCTPFPSPERRTIRLTFSSNEKWMKTPCNISCVDFEREGGHCVCVFCNVPPDWTAGLGHYPFSPWWIKECWRAYRYARFLLPVCAPKLATSTTPRQLAEAVIKTSTTSHWFQANYNIYNSFRAQVILCIAHSTLVFTLCRLSTKSDFFFKRLDTVHWCVWICFCTSV